MLVLYRSYFTLSPEDILTGSCFLFKASAGIFAMFTCASEGRQLVSLRGSIPKSVKLNRCPDSCDPLFCPINEESMCHRQGEAPTCAQTVLISAPRTKQEATNNEPTNQGLLPFEPTNLPYNNYLIRQSNLHIVIELLFGASSLGRTQRKNVSSKN